MFETNENIFLIKKHNNESNTFYHMKCKFLSQCDFKKHSFEYLLKLSTIYTNNKLYGCEYDSKIMNELKQFIV
jgi:hypothetical protein